MPNENKISNVERARGQKLYMTFSVFNSLSYICLADSLFILFALKMGCPDYVVALFGAFMYLGNVAMFLARRLIARIGAGKTIFVFWVCRNLAGLLAASAPFFNRFFPVGGVLVLVFSSFVFYICRSGGVLGMQPLVGEITFPDKRGKFVSGVYMAYNVTAVLGFAGLIYLFREESTIGLFQGILVTGAMLGLTSTIFIFRVKETETPKNSARSPIKNEWNKILGNLVYKKLLWTNILTFSSIAIIVPTSMLALKEGYMLPNYQALFFSLIQFAGGILIAYISRVLSDETGPRPLIILYHCLLSVIAVFWIFAPSELSWFYVFIIFLLCGCCFMGIPLVLLNYFLAAVKAEERVGVSLFISISSGICAGVAGMILGSGTLKVLHFFDFSPPLDLYRVYFGIALIFLLPSIYFITKLEKQKDWEVKDVLGLLFAPRDIRALFLINSIEHIESPVKENLNINKLESVTSGLSQKKLLAYLESPKFQVRGRTIHALSQMKLNDDAKKSLIRELDVGEFTTAFYAAQALGEQGVKEAIPVLTRKLDSTDSYLKGKAMYALAQLGEKSSYHKIESIFEETDNPRLIIHGALALAEIGDPEALALLLRKSVSGIPRQARYEILLAIAQISGIPDSFYKFLKHFMIDRELSKNNLLEYIENLSLDPMCEELKEALERFNEEEEEGMEEIVRVIRVRSKKDHLKIISIIDDFLSECEPQKFHAELLYCIICVLRKNGAL